MSNVPGCFMPPDLAHAVPQKPTKGPEFSTNVTEIGRSNQDVTGIELPNPNLAVYKNGLGDFVGYPLDVPTQAKEAKQLPPASLYQRNTRRPWDISTQQFAKQMNKRISAGLLQLAFVTFLVYPMIGRPNKTTDSGPRFGYGLNSVAMIQLPAPKKDVSFAK